MLTLGRFRVLAESYGADLRRWPEEVRTDARVLLNVSSEARALLDAARRLDDAIEATSACEAAPHGQSSTEAAALARLRSGVAARIAASADPRPINWRSKWTLAEKHGFALAPHLRWVGIAAGCGIAVVAGFLIGVTYTSSLTSDNVLAMLQPAPIHILAD